jgi:hypothetical protein
MEEPTFIKTGKKEFDELYPRIKAFLLQDSLDMEIDGEKIRGYRSPDSRAIWIRDHSDILRGAKYIEKDMKSAVEHFAATQAANGRIFDYFTIYPDKLSCQKENWTKYVRVPVEADVEYRFIKAAYIAWQAAGDDQWIKDLLPHMEKALHYVLTDPQRWNDQHQLVKRAYTIDTWDFAYTAGKNDWLEFQITDNTFWGIMHGDNSGYYEAFRIMELLYDFFQNPLRAQYWREQAEGIRSRMNRVCWNGRFYTHFVKLTPVDIPGVEEEAQLSLSNPMDINRGTASHEKAVCILQEYKKRRQETQAFAEWFSIDPPFPTGIFGDEKLKPGAYINGGILPLVGGELAKAAFDHGFETYGVDILTQYYEKIADSGETFLWYFPDGSPSSVETSTSPEATSTDGWGSSAMLYAMIEGLAGVEDRLKLFRTVRLSPRWPAAGVNEAEVRLQYAASGSSFGYLYRSEEKKIVLEIEANEAAVQFHILLSEGLSGQSVRINNKKVDFSNTVIENSAYVDFRTAVKKGANIEILL